MDILDYPKYIRIISCSDNSLWYKNDIGKIYEFYDFDCDDNFGVRDISFDTPACLQTILKTDGMMMW